MFTSYFKGSAKTSTAFVRYLSRLFRRICAATAGVHFVPSFKSPLPVTLGMQSNFLGTPECRPIPKPSIPANVPPAGVHFVPSFNTLCCHSRNAINFVGTPECFAPPPPSRRPSSSCNEDKKKFMDNGGLRFVDGQQQRPFAHEEVVFCFYLMMTNRGEKNTWVGALSWRTSLLC